MKSAFGVIHKGIPSGLPKAAGLGVSSRGAYSMARLKAHNKGKLGFEGGKKARTKARKILQSYEAPRPDRKLP